MKSLIWFAVLSVACVCLLTSGPISGDEPKNAAGEQLLSLKLERLKSASAYGEAHPRVKMLDKQIEMIQKHLEGQPQVADDEIDDADLHRIVKGLLERVQTLEKEVAMLKARKPKVELLRD